MKKICKCNAYRFPHRMFSGSCLANEQGPFCGACGHPCEPVWINEEDQYEFWGQIGTHRVEYCQSDCCQDLVFEDAALSKEYGE